MNQILRLAHINIEGSKHLERVIPFLQNYAADVVCMQELNEPDIHEFESKLGMKCFFAPMNIREDASKHGVGIFSAVAQHNAHASQYGGSTEKELPLRDATNKQTMHDTKRFLLASADIEKDGELFRIITTHFPVTLHGEATDYQREDMKKMLELLEREGDFVFTGDFNAPRGGEIFGMLASNYTDNIPPEITTSIDGTLHRAGQLPHMVDGIFSTSGYVVSNVEQHSGLSDHRGFTADIKKVEI